MKIVLKLTLANLRQYPARLLLTSLATVAAAAMVVWVVSGYDALLQTFHNYSDKALGRYPLAVAPISTFRQYAPGDLPSSAVKYVQQQVLDDLRADPAVIAADPMWVRRVLVQVTPGAGGSAGRGAGLRGGGPEGRGAGPGGGDETAFRILRTPDARLLGIDSPEPPFPITEGRWLGTEGSAPSAGERPCETVATVSAAKRLRLGLEGTVRVGQGERARTCVVVGLMDTPFVEGFSEKVAAGQLLTPGVGDLFVSLDEAQGIFGGPRQISLVGVSLKPEVDINEFRFSWSHKLSRFEVPTQFQEAYDVEEALDESASAENVLMQAYAATGMALLAALFIVFSTLSMGVSERTRQFAILRAVALTRAQIAAMIALEGFILATIGFVGGVGAGQVLLMIAASGSPELLGGASLMGTYSLTLAAVCAYGGTFLAAITPAWRATRVKPLDAMAPRITPEGGRLHTLSLIIGVGLAALGPVLIFVVGLPEGDPFSPLMLASYAAMAVGFILAAPGVVWLMDRFGGPILARILRIEPKLLANQLSSNQWRTVGTAVALSVGLSIYVSIQVWGQTMLSAFVPGPWAPDAMISFNPGGISTEQAQDFAQKAPGVNADRALPVVFEQPRLAEDLTGSAERATVTRQDSVVIVGVDAQRAFGGEHPLFAFEWLEGSREEAVAQIATGRGCIVPDHFLRESGLKVGDHFDLVPPDRPERPVRYTIAGAVRMHGWHWQTKPVGFRARTHRAAALIFANYAEVAQDFGRAAASHLWFDYADPPPSFEALGQQAQTWYAEQLGVEVARRPVPNEAPYVRVMPVEGIRTIVDNHARQWLWAMSQLPLIILLITSIGVLNAILASIRARRWDFGVLRAIGFTRWSLVRLVIAEGMLVGLVTAILSVAFGLLAGWSGAGVSQYISFFGGMYPPLVVPWLDILWGVLAAVALSTVAAIWPALSIGRTQPLALLQQGRGAF